MARPRKTIPELLWHSGAKQFYARFSRVDQRYYGKDRPGAERKYRQDLARWLAGVEAGPAETAEAGAREGDARRAPASATEALTLSEAALKYAEVAAGKVCASQLERIKTALDAACELYGEDPAAAFDQLKLEKVREQLLLRTDRRGGRLTARLREILREGPRRTSEVLAQLRGEGFRCSHRLSRSRRVLGIVARKERGKGGRWLMELPSPGTAAEAGARRLSRTYVNHLVRCVQTAFRWLSHRKLVPAVTAAEVGALRALEPDEGGEETAPVQPISPEVVALTLPCLGPVVAAMVRVQQLTGMRPGEVCRLRRKDLSTCPAEVLQAKVGGGVVRVHAIEAEGIPVWVFAPPKHKNSKRKKVRVVAIGPAAQQILAPYLEGRKPDDYLFVPAESAAIEAVAKKRRVVDATNGARAPGKRYTTQSYGQAIGRAAVRAGVQEWAPNRLRHHVATTVAEDHDQDTAAAVLGHSRPDMTAHYVLSRLKTAAGVAAVSG